MIVENLTKGSKIYTSNAYLCTEDNTQGCGILVDTGCDPDIISTLHTISNETRHPPMKVIILTHSHYDHTRMIKEIRRGWPDVITYAFSAYLDGIDQVVTGGEKIAVCNLNCEIIHLPGHSTDSVCIYFPREGILFSGDSPIFIWGTEATYELPFLTAFEALTRLNIQEIYPGHGEPILQECNRKMDQSLRNLKKSRII
jgi:glyoxylase-like metal-dependent hydrolase (beta-lactamase superfamily II)